MMTEIDTRVQGLGNVSKIFVMCVDARSNCSLS